MGQDVPGRDSLLRAVRRNLAPKKAATLVKRGFRLLRQSGLQAVWREIVFRFNLACRRPVWRYRADIPLRREISAQRKHALANAPLISVVSPLYNTNKTHVKQMLKSVAKQSYTNWQLVLVDASDVQHAYVGRIAKTFEQKDARVKYVRLSENKSIAENTNAGFSECKGQWITLLDHDDVLQKNALYEIAACAQNTGAKLIYSDEAVLSSNLKKLHEFHFKGGYGSDTLRGCNYIGHLCAFTRQLLNETGQENSEFDGAQDYELMLRICEKAGEKGVYHIPKVLYYWRRHTESTAAGIEQKPAALMAGANAINAQLTRLGLQGVAEPQKNALGSYRVCYKVDGTPKLSIIIPNCEHTEDLEKCIEAVYTKGGFGNIEVLVIENNSKLQKTFDCYKKLESTYKELKVLRYGGGFNFSAICNFGAKHANGSQLLLLNNDVQIISEDFLKEMLSYSQRSDVGAVGAKLYYPDDTVQHAGLIIGIGGTAGASHKGHARGNGGDMFRLCTTQNVSAVTGAALMVKKELYNELGGLDEENFAVAFNDVDFCLRLREKGYLNVFTPFAEAYHYESKSRGYDIAGERKERHNKEAENLKTRWAKVFSRGDEYYNPHFTLITENFALR